MNLRQTRKLLTKVPFNTLLSADLVYIADSASGVPAYSPMNNDMYQSMENNNVDLKAHLVSSSQSALRVLPVADIPSNPASVESQSSEMFGCAIVARCAWRSDGRARVLANLYASIRIWESRKRCVST